MFDVRKLHFAVRVVTLAILTTLVLALALPAFAQPDAQLLGPEDQSKQINVTYWLKQHNKAALDELVRQQYDPASPNYHHWLTPSEYQARFAPTAADMAVVNKHLAANNLQVVRTDSFNHAVTARGTVGDIQRATGVQINRVLINGEEHRRYSGELAISGAAGKLVYAVQGLTDMTYKSLAMRPIDPDTGKPFPAFPLNKADLVKSQTISQYFNPRCLRGTQTIHLKTPGGGPYEIYSGTRYGGNITAGPPNLPPCGYDSTQMQTAYGLKAVYQKGFLGQNQNNVIVHWNGDDSITSDANAFSSINGLPPLTTDNFGIFYPGGPTNCGGNTCGADVETALDVEWAHAMAPKANIALVLALDASFTSTDLALLYAIDNGIGPVISNSWGASEAEIIAGDPSELTVGNNIAETGAALGISLNFATGDSGDIGIGGKVKSVGWPASSPYVTAVGGTSLFIDSNFGTVQTGWGTNITRIASYTTGCGQPTCDPVLLDPNFLGFYGGAGGGTSAYWTKPSFQKKLPGTFRMVPDIAYLADPYTGAEFVDTEGGQQFVSVVGGTSLATPMFSGVWAIANQAAGHLLGQAAPLLYKLPAGTITDIVAYSGPNNVSGMTDSPPLPPTTFSAATLASPLENPVDQVDFMSLMYQGTSTRWYALTFGTDSSLNAVKGWDNVTGLGTPNGLNFINAFVGKK